MPEAGTSPPTQNELLSSFSRESGRILTLENQVTSEDDTITNTTTIITPEVESDNSIIKTFETPEIDETISRLSSRKHVHGVVVCNLQGRLIKSTLSEQLSREYSTLMKSLIEQARSAISKLDQDNEVTFMRIRTKKHEIMLGPDKQYLLIVIQTPGI